MVNSSLPPIIIELPQEETSGAVSQVGTGNTQSQKGGGSAKSLLAKAVSFGTVKHIADEINTYAISTVEMRTGAREYEQKLSFWYSTASRAVTSAAIVVAGIKTGHPLIALAGLVVGGVAKGYEIWKNYNNLRIAENREDVAIHMATIRTGALGRRENGGRNGQQ